MYQRADERPDPNRTTPTPIDQPTTEERRLSTADLAASGQPRPEFVREDPRVTDQAPANVTPINTAANRPVPAEGHATSERTALFRPEDAESFRSRWVDV